MESPLVNYPATVDKGSTQWADEVEDVLARIPHCASLDMKRTFRSFLAIPEEPVDILLVLMPQDQ